MTIIISGDTGVPVSPVTGTLAVANGGTGVTTSTGSGANVLGTSPSISGAVMSTMGSSVITSGTAVASTSGTSIDFTSIPSWVKRITVMFSGVSTNGSSNWLLQLGTGGVATTTGYTSAAGRVYTGTSTQTSTSGFILGFDNAAFVVQGIITFANVSGNTWAGSGTVSSSASTAMSVSLGGVVGLANVLNMVRITTVNGTDTFDAGTINILYE